MAGDRLPNLRAAIKASGVDGLIVPRADAYPGSFVPESAERLKWLTGFTGSAGFAVVLQDKAALFTDGRYQLQAGQEIDGALYQIVHSGETTIADWIGVGRDGLKLGFDAELMTEAAKAKLDKGLKHRGVELVALAENPVDALWTDRPAPPLSPCVPHPVKYSGVAHTQKIEDAASGMKDSKLDAFIISQPESLAWLLNVRGADVPNTPLALGFAILHSTARVGLYMAPEKLSEDTRQHLGDQVEISDVTAFEDGLKGLSGKAVGCDFASANAWIVKTLKDTGADVKNEGDPCVLAKALKNKAERAGARAAHTRDGAALVKFLRWAEENASGLTEWDVAQKTESVRASNDHYKGPSFDPIVGSGPNGAVIHYHPTADKSSPILKDNLLLVDSGGQYLDGTTDVTRTLVIGEPTEEMTRAYTLVLKGHVALSAQRFPAGTKGSGLDSIARQFLWAEGMNYDHGTGHGVGSYLGVHEGPQNISSRGEAVLMADMVLSIEPGYYKADAFGIRIENLALVVDAGESADGRNMLAFEALTQAPYARKLIDARLLTASEKDWLNAYHAGVLERLTPLLEGDDLAWLKAQCQPF